MRTTPEPGPKSFAVLFGGSETSPVADPWSVYRRLRREEPVALIEGLQGDVYLLSRYEDVREALRNDAIFSNRSNAQGISIVMGRTIVEMDGREHLKHRNLITPALAPRALKGNFPQRVTAIANALIDEFADRGHADLVKEFTFTFPLRVFTEILGLPVEDHEAVHRWAADLALVAIDPARGLAASQTLADYMRPVVEKRRTDATGDLISRLVHAEVDGERLTDEEVISFLRLLVIAGAETTYHLIGSALYGLLTTEGALEEVRRDRTLLQAVMDETLRWESPVQIVTRETIVPTRVADVDVPEGAQIVVGIGSANRDERVFPEPDRFDLHRAENEHLAFGFGKHYCAGSRLAYLEARTALDALLDRLPNLRLAPGEACGVVGLAFRGPDRLPVEFG